MGLHNAILETVLAIYLLVHGRDLVQVIKAAQHLLTIPPGLIETKE